MIGLDFPVKPEWIHAALNLWQPGQPVEDLVEAALIQAMPDVEGEKSRRNSLSIILRLFVPTEGNNRGRKTTDSNAWAAHSKTLPPTTLAPAYLTGLISDSEVAREAAAFIARRHAPGDRLTSSELRQVLVNRYGERTVVINSVSAFLRSLQYFRVLQSGDRLGEYFYQRRLTIEREIFPLLVWTWWKRQPTPQIDLEAFEQSPIFSFLETDGFERCWSAYQPGLWVLSERLGSKTSTIKASDDEAFSTLLTRYLLKN
ncbi:MAG: hypothetical protein AB1649_12215 [Chloroflexota bacterium]